ncbi:hypothetical protein [Nocardia sp. NPDC052566]
MLPTDHVKIVDQPFRIVGAIPIPHNPITGWSPGKRFRITRGF